MPAFEGLGQGIAVSSRQAKVTLKEKKTVWKINTHKSQNKNQTKTKPETSEFFCEILIQT